MSATELLFTVFGTPVAWQRTGQNRSGKFYTKDETRDFKRLVAQEAHRAMRQSGFEVLDGACEMEIHAWWPALKSAKPTSTQGTRKKTRPDWDNVGKGVSDALNGIVYTDDGRVTDAHVTKRHCDRGGLPGVTVVVRSLEGEWDK